MKKIILIIGIVVSTFALSSCGSASTSEAPANDSLAMEAPMVDSSAVMVDSAATDTATVVDTVVTK